MRQSEWKIRCYARREAPGLWVALCLDFDLAAQGETFEEARNHLDGVITEYVADALTGPDHDHAAGLLNRRAPWRYWLQCHLLGLAQWVRGRTPSGRQSFQETLPLAVAR